MRCEKCGHYQPNPISQAGGKVGGRAKVAKGFASPDVQAKAQKTRLEKKKMKGWVAGGRNTH